MHQTLMVPGSTELSMDILKVQLWKDYSWAYLELKNLGPVFSKGN